LKSWWASSHFNRPLGVETGTSTSWVPQSKPIWFTELGCPAIDKGSNQPNQFFDAKSSESGWPYYSGGQQDSQIQQAYIKASQNYWGTVGAQNPVSAVYGAAMVDATRLFYWCWDARPFPAFPARSDVWGDGANYARGHWLNGRAGLADLASLITFVAARFGFVDVDVAAVESLVDGFVLDRPMSAREALETLLQVFAIDCFESSGKLKFVARRTNIQLTIASTDLIEDERDAPNLSRHRAQETDLPVAIHLGYAESGLDYRQAAVHQQRLGTSSKNETALTLPAALSQPLAQQRVDVAVAESWAAREMGSFTLSPRYEAIEPGDILNLDGNLWRVKTVMAGTTRKIEALAHDPAAYDAPPALDRRLTNTSPVVLGAPDTLIMDLALASATTSAAPWVAAQASPWPGTLAIVKKTGPASFALNTVLNQQATMGTSLTSLSAGLEARIDFNQPLDILLKSGTLSSISNDQLLNGGNLAAFGTPDTGFELIQFQNAVLIAPNTYRLSGLLRAQAGSGPEMLALRPAGQNLVMINNATRQLSLSIAEAGQGARWRIGPAQLDYGSAAYVELTTVGSLRPLRPLSPAQIKLAQDPAGVLVSWIRRTRVDGDSWELIEVPLSEASELYQLDVMAAGVVKRSITLTTPNYLYATADIVTDFGALPSSLTLRVAQISAAFGSGAVLERTINV
jgi:hypothetical protein